VRHVIFTLSNLYRRAQSEASARLQAMDHGVPVSSFIVSRELGRQRSPARRGREALSFGTVPGSVGKRDEALRRKLLEPNRAPVAQVDRAAAF
jgi:hypothetical protein